MKNCLLIAVEFDAYLAATGDYNFAFDAWFTSGNPPRPEDVVAEMMIWVDRSNWERGSETLIANVEIDGREYALYYRTDHTISSGLQLLQFIFIAHEDQYSGRLDLKKFIDLVVDDGLLSEDLYITGVEFGNEILVGTGELWLKEYRVHAR